MPTLAELLATNPHGWGSAPPSAIYQGDITSTLGPTATDIAKKYGPKAGSLAQVLLNGWDTAGEAAKGVAKGLSGISAAQDAGANLSKAVDEGDPVKGAGSIVQAGLAALPAAGRLAEPLVATAPRLASMLLAGGLGGAAAEGALSPDTAEAKTHRPSSPPVENSPLVTLPGLTNEQSARLQTLNRKVQNADWQSGTERKAIIAEKQQLEGLSADAQRANNVATAKAAEIEATAKAQREAEAAAAAQKADAEKAELDKPFQARHPELSTALTLGAPVASGVLAATGLGRVASKGKSLLSELLAAREAGDVGKMAETAARLDQWQKSAPIKQAASIVVPSTIPADARVMGDVVDKYSLPDSSQAQQDASDRLGDPVQYAKDAVPAIASGLVWGGVGSKLAPAAPRGDAKAMLSMYGGKNPETLSNMLKSQADASKSVQGPIGQFQSAQKDRQAAGALTDRRDQLLGEAAGVAPETSPDLKHLPSPAPAQLHYSNFQPKDKNNRFRPGKPKLPKNDN